EPERVGPAPAPVLWGPPAATSVLYWTCEARLGLPIPSVRQRALLGARPPLASTQSPMRPRTPRRTRRSKRTSLRSLSFVAGEKAPRATHIDKSAGTDTHPPSTRVSSCPFWLWSILVVCSSVGPQRSAKQISSGRNQKINDCLHGWAP